jgi:hypothetical protein
MADVKDILDKLDKLDTRIDNIDITLARQNVTLEDHVRRSSANEETLEIVRNEADVRIRSLESYKDKILGAFAILGILGTLAVGIKQLGLF